MNTVTEGKRPLTIGLPTELKAQEARVAILPAGVAALVEQGCSILVQQGVGQAAGFRDEAYRAVGARVLANAADVYGNADVIVKVKEPLEQEFALLREKQILFCYLHSETRPQLVDTLLRKRMTGIAFENVLDADGGRPLLRPMSILAGQQAVLQGMQFLCNHRGGSGISLVSYPGLPRPQVIVLGGGVAGEAAARVAAGLGAQVFVFDVNWERLRFLQQTLPPNVTALHNDLNKLTQLLPDSDMLIHTTTIAAHSRRFLLTRDQVKCMRPGSVIVDVTANLHGAIESVDRHTTHADPVYTVDGVIHYVVPNIPGTVAQTASRALAMAVQPYLLRLADQGVRRALESDPGFQAGLTCVDGVLTWHEAGEGLNLPWTSPAEALTATPTSPRASG